MLNALLSLPQAYALVLAALLLAFALWVLRGSLRYLVTLLILVLCRAVICANFGLLFSGLGLLAISLGALADFFFLSPFLLMQPGHKRELFAMIAALALVAANVADTAYALETSFRLQYMFFENLDPTAMLIRKDYLLFSLGGAVLLVWLFWKLYFRPRVAPVPRPLAWSFVGVCGLVFLSSFVEAPSVMSTITGVQNAEPKTMLKVVADSALRNFFQDAIWPSPNRRMSETAYSDADRHFLEEFGLIGPRQAGTRLDAAYDRVIVVFVESLSYQFVQGKPQREGAAAMPFLQSLLADPGNVALARYYSSAFSTNDALYAALASRPDFGGDVLARHGAATVFSLAAERGYQTAFFLGSSGDFGHIARNYRGTLRVENVYDKAYNPGLPPAEEESEWGELDQRLFEKMLVWIREHKADKFVIAASTIDTHPPFYRNGPPPPGVEDNPLSRAFYSTDRALEFFFAGLKDMGLPDERTLIIVTGDHQITHGGKIVLEQLHGGEFGERRLPLVFVAGDRRPLAAVNADTLCSAVDIAPTLGDLLALPDQPTYYGKSLLLPGEHYELALTRDGLLMFNYGKLCCRLKLGKAARGVVEDSLHDWYFNTQQGFHPEARR